MIDRYIHSEAENALRREAAVALIGPRQVGKTTLALEIAQSRRSVYLDLERPADKEKLSDPEAFLNLHTDDLVVIDEIHRLPELFESLRGLIDRGRRDGKEYGRFLLLGSASIELMRQSETLAGRIEYIDLDPLHALEIAPDETNKLWARGGFPRSFLARNDDESFRRRLNLIRTYLERDIPMFGPRVPAETLERLWTMLAHNQGGTINYAQLARNIGVTAPSVSTYIDLLCDLLLIRRLKPFHANVKKRLVKSPKVYIRDSGLVHALLGIESLDELMGHPVVGASREGFVIENLLAVSPPRTHASFYRTAKGAEIDLLLELGGKHGTWAVEIKRGSVPKASKGFFIALEDIRPARAFIVYGGTDRYPKGDNIEAIGFRELVEEVAALSER